MYPNMENNENVLEKYGRNITEDAKNGKIDPVMMKKFVVLPVFYLEKQRITQY